MPPLVVPGICRFTLHGNVGPRPWACIFDMDIDSDVASDRDANITDQAQVFLNEWIDHIRPVTADDVSMTGCRWVDLDTLDGTTGEAVVASSPRVMPSAGTLTADPLPVNVAIFAKKQVDAGRGKRKGRTYWPGVTESQNTGGGPDAATITAWNTALANFRDGVNQDHDGLFNYDSRMVVVHEPAGAEPSFDVVSNYVVDNKFATQRRRLRK